MANFIQIKAIVCCTEEVTQFVVDDATSAITTGNTYYFTAGEKLFCATVDTTSINKGPATATFTGDYTSCEECLSGITTAVKVIDCTRGESYFIDMSTFTTLPSFGEVYYMTITLGDDIITNCFTIDCFVTPGEGDKVLSLTSISDLYTGCTECLVNNVETYSVTPCLTSSIDTYYINLPLGFDYTNYIINFIDESGNSICGTATGVLPTETNGTLISILGLSVDSGGDVTCEDCLTVSSERRIITNCLTGGTEVVWGSTFYGGAEVTNLSTADGCFEVGDITESAVTINTFLDYNPQPDCQECIQCNGVIYSYSSCTNSGPLYSVDIPIGVTSALPDAVYGPFTATTTSINGIGATFNLTVESGVIINIPSFGSGIGYQVGDIFTINKDDFSGDTDFVFTATSVSDTGAFLSYQYVQDPIGKTTYIPFLNDCVEITGVSTNGTYQYTIYSFDVFDDCSLCESNDFYVWKTRDCATDISYIVTVSSNSFTIGDFVKVKWGTTDFQCHELVSPYDFVTDGFLIPYKSETLTPFDDCETCNSGTLIGASIVKCGGGGQQFVNIPIGVWNTMAGHVDSQLVFVTEEYGQCYILLNNCPLEPNYDTLTPLSTYYNCLTCYLDNTRFPRSAGTESFICLQICTESGTTVVSVSGPHPEWTDGYGTQVTQLDMFTLGGPNGLNN